MDCDYRGGENECNEKGIYSCNNYELSFYVFSWTSSDSDNDFFPAYIFT